MSSDSHADVIYRPFPGVLEASFIRRINRFLVECETGDRRLLAFLPNPGRLQELLLPRSRLFLIPEYHRRERLTDHTVVAVMRDGYPVMLHTHRTNDVVRRLIEESLVPGLEGAKILKEEVRAGRSRFDFLLHHKGSEVFLEVKSCTLAGKEVAMFPDAITARGAKHLEELAFLSSGRTRCAVIFVIQWPLASVFMPDYHTDLHFARTMLAVRHSLSLIPLSVTWLPDLSLSRHVRLLEIPWSYVQRETEDRGSYIVILRLDEEREIDVGKLKRLFFPKGFYLYVGSAMKSLSKRVERHRRLRKRLHWHIDYLRCHAAVHATLPIRSSERLECAIARGLEDISAWSIEGFGSSDCLCRSHLFGWTTDPLESPRFHRLLQGFRMDRYHPLQWP